MSLPILPAVGEKISLIVMSTPYRGEYQVQVLETGKEMLVITMPTRNGAIVPLAGGEEITISYAGGGYQGQVLNRSFGQVRTLTITAPGVRSLAGRSSPSGMASNPPQSVTSVQSRDGAQFITVTSGKGGVGKSTLTINLSLALITLGLKVCMVDVDLGTANLDLMLGMTAGADLGSLLEGKPLEEVLTPVAKGLTLLPGSSGVGAVANLNHWQMSRLVSSFNKLSENYDIVLMDTGAGVGDNVTGFIHAADQVVLVTTPDPTAITDAYALLKVMAAKADLESPWHLVVNRSEGTEAEGIKANFSRTVLRHLNMNINYLGCIPDSRNIASSVRQQRPYLTQGLGGKEDWAYHQLARQLVGLPLKKKNFLQKFQEVLKKIG